MKKTNLLLVLVLIGTLLVGCGNSNDSSDTSSGTSNQGSKDNSVKKLQMLWWNEGVEGDVIQNIIDDLAYAVY